MIFSASNVQIPPSNWEHKQNVQEVVERLGAFGPAWEAILNLAHRFSTHSGQLSRENYWPLLGLSKRIASILQATSTLAVRHLWVDAMIFGRTLFEIETIVAWLTQEDTDERLQIYVSGIDDEKLKLERKMEEGRSAMSQTFALYKDLLNLPNTPPKQNSNPTWKGQNIRDLSSKVDLERVYDFFYWVSSVFAHGHVLSLMVYHADPIQKEPLLSSLFTDDYSKLMVLTTFPSSAERSFAAVNTALGLQFADEIATAKAKIVEATMSGIGGKVGVPESMQSVANNIKVGDVLLTNGDETLTISPVRRPHGKKGKAKKRK